MSLEFYLWVFWMYLSVNGNIGVPTKDYRYQKKPDSRNLLHEHEHEAGGMTFPAFDQLSNWQPSSRSGLPPLSSDNPSAPQLMDDDQGNKPNVERLLNGESRDWGSENLDEPLVFPLKPKNQGDLPNPSTIQIPSTNGMPKNAGYDPYFAGHVAYYEPAPPATAEAAQSPEPASSGSGMTNPAYGSSKQVFNTGSSTDGEPHRVFEEVFHYPPGNQGSGTVSTSSGGYDQSNSKGGSPALAPRDPFTSSNSRWVGLPFLYNSLSGDKQDYIKRLLPKDARTPKVNAPQRVDPPAMPPPPSSYIVQSNNGYKRMVYRMTKSRYSPEYPVSLNEATRVEAPAKSPPAAAKV